MDARGEGDRSILDDSLVSSFNNTVTAVVFTKRNARRLQVWGRKIVFKLYVRYTSRDIKKEGGYVHQEFRGRVCHENIYLHEPGILMCDFYELLRDRKMIQIMYLVNKTGRT